MQARLIEFAALPLPSCMHHCVRSATSLPSRAPRPPNECIVKWGTQLPTSVTLRDLCEIGLDKERRREHGVFLHRELRIRMAQRVLELHSLPYGLPERPGIRDVIRWYSRFVLDLEQSPVPTTPAQDEEFTNLLVHIFEEHSEVIQAMARGVQSLMAELGDDYKEAQPQVDASLRRFFMSRIGLRFLIQHHIESLNNRPGHSGILQLDCSPAEVVRKCAQDSMGLCRASLGQAPRIIVEETLCGQTGTFTYVPMHLSYMMTELFKNACRATTELHATSGFDDLLPAIRCQIVHGHEDVTIKVSDEGGGLSRNQLKNVFKFMYTTCKKSPWEGPDESSVSSFAEAVVVRPLCGASADNPLQRQKKGVLAGYGVGLSLSRLYSMYFGGDLKLLSLDGYGTDAYLHLNRLGTNCENLPTMVQHSPSMRDSSLSAEEDHDVGELLISTEEEAFLVQELASWRRKQAGKPC
mmetsp:Transcript_41599/g.75425  ORF Transcript_41599/g.75425 Transcript_41599/m.75425 type:complete len:466 (+) Transcript_41599:90-1487(+)